MRNIFLLLFIATVAMAQKCDKDPQTEPQPQQQIPAGEGQDIRFDEGISGKIGERAARVIRHADGGEAYQLNPEAGLPEGSPGLQGILVVGEPAPLTSDQLTDLKLQIGQDSLYSFSSSMNMCLFLPDYGLSFTQGDSARVDLLISMHCNEFRFYEGENLISVDCAAPAAKVHEYISKMFE